MIVVAEASSHRVLRLTLETLRLVAELVAFTALTHKRAKTTLVATSTNGVGFWLLALRIHVAVAAFALDAPLRGFVALVRLVRDFPPKL